MSTQSLLIGNFGGGFENDRKPFVINNDAFPTVTNAYIWRGRILKKRGTTQLGRLQVNLTSVSLGNTGGGGALTVNLVTFLTLPLPSSIVIRSITITVGAQVFTESTPGTLSNGAGGTGTINYATGLLSIQTSPPLAATPVLINFGYYPSLPVMGLENFQTSALTFPTLVAFDTTYSYQINSGTQIFHNVNFYKISGAPFVWTGMDFQQFWTASYQGSMFTTNGVPGMSFLVITNVTYVGTTTTVTVMGPLNLNGLMTGDYVFLNEVIGIVGVNGVSGPITVTGAATFTIVTPTVPTGAYMSGGIVQSMTRAFSGYGDGIRWYDGDHTASSSLGWVNFSPPVTSGLDINYKTIQYLIGANLIVPFKDRLLAFGVTFEDVTGTRIYYPSRIVASQVGTGYYSTPVPINQGFDPHAWLTDTSGRNGVYLDIPVPQAIVSVQANKDVLIIGLEGQQFKLVATGDDSFPFVLQGINEELGTESTFSGVSLDTGALTVGPYGIIMTSQVSAQRIDLSIPDAVFSIAAENNGLARVTAIRDFRNEFVYFTYAPEQDESFDLFPTQTLLYNYRENNWALFEENYTHYGTYRKPSNYVWGDLGRLFGTWATWGNPWNFGIFGADYPDIIGGNQQGFVMIKDKGTQEDVSQYISGISGTTVTSPNHCLNDADYLLLSGILGTTNMPLLNGMVQKVLEIIDGNNFIIEGLPPDVNGNPVPITGTYLGGGVYSRLTNINVLTKQFPLFWQQGRKMRIGTQRFLMENSFTGQITVNIYADQNNVTSLNDPLINPYLIYSNILLTGPETNDMVGVAQDQIWHRLSNSFNGGTIQIGFTLSDAQMRSPTTNSVEIGIHAIAFDLYPGPILV
jgi:hypothetical protein